VSFDRHDLGIGILEIFAEAARARRGDRGAWAHLLDHRAAQERERLESIKTPAHRRANAKRSWARLAADPTALAEYRDKRRQYWREYSANKRRTA